MFDPTQALETYQLRDINSICRCCWNATTYKMNINVDIKFSVHNTLVYNGKIEIISCCRVRSEPVLTVNL